MTAEALWDERRATQSAETSARTGFVLVLALIVTCQLMLVLDATVVNVGLPPIQEDLGFSATGLSWVVNAYTLAFGGLLLLGGRLGDAFGRRRVFGAGVALFTISSLVGGASPSEAVLVAARAAQGVGAALGIATTELPNGTGIAAADTFATTSAPGVFAAGDADGAGNLAAAIAGGSLAATGLHSTLVAGQAR